MTSHLCIAKHVTAKLFMVHSVYGHGQCLFPAILCRHSVHRRYRSGQNMMSWPGTAAQLLSPGGRAPGTLCTYQAPLDGVRGGISVIHQSDTITNVSEPLTPDSRRPPDTATTTCLQPSVPPPLHIYQSINHNLLIQISGHKYSSVKTFICATTIGSFQLYLLYFCQVSSVPCYQMFSVTVTDICIGCHGLNVPPLTTVAVWWHTYFILYGNIQNLLKGSQDQFVMS